ncbi:MAG: hypothetical protein QGF45_11495, partial [SAR324 cluster bacterium]|nr:hypothetical protein [SAR324 cluster bacterium]
MKAIKFALIIIFSIFINNLSLAKESDQLIREIVDEAASVLSSSKSVNLKIETLNDIAERSVDINGIGMYALGKYRKILSDERKTKYKKLFNKLDGLIYLKVRDFCLLRKWRLKQEKKLWLKTSSKKNLKIMNKKEVINFMSTYQRITQHMFNDMPKISSVIMNLNDKHQINK